MKHYVIHDVDGVIRQTAALNDDAGVPTINGLTTIEIDSPIDPKEFHINGGLLVAGTIKSKEKDRAKKHAFTHLGKDFAGDSVSRAMIVEMQGYVLIADELPAKWSGGWESLDGSVLPITNSADWYAFYSSMVINNKKDNA